MKFGIYKISAVSQNTPRAPQKSCQASQPCNSGHFFISVQCSSHFMLLSDLQWATATSPCTRKVSQQENGFQKVASLSPNEGRSLLNTPSFMWMEHQNISMAGNKVNQAASSTAGSFWLRGAVILDKLSICFLHAGINVP